MPGSETWVLVADGARARLFRADRRNRSLELVEEEDSSAARAKAADIVTDRPGRHFDGNTLGQRSAMEPSTDPKQLEKRRFARHLASRLGEARRAGRFDDLVIVAAPQTLGDLRAELPPAVASHVTAEIDKDLTGGSPAELGRHLAPVLWPLST